jgi:hypothetical protein
MAFGVGATVTPSSANRDFVRRIGFVRPKSRDFPGIAGRGKLLEIRILWRSLPDKRHIPVQRPRCKSIRCSKKGIGSGTRRSHRFRRIGDILNKRH